MLRGLHLSRRLWFVQHVTPKEAGELVTCFSSNAVADLVVRFLDGWGEELRRHPRQWAGTIVTVTTNTTNVVTTETTISATATTTTTAMEARVTSSMCASGVLGIVFPGGNQLNTQANTLVQLTWLGMVRVFGKRPQQLMVQRQHLYSAERQVQLHDLQQNPCVLLRTS